MDNNNGYNNGGYNNGDYNNGGYNNGGYYNDNSGYSNDGYNNNYNNGYNNNYNGYNPTPPAHGMAIGSLVCGIISFFCCGPLAIVSLILHIMAKKEGNTEGITTAGLVLSIISLCFMLIGIIYYIVLILLGLSIGFWSV